MIKWFEKSGGNLLSVLILGVTLASILLPNVGVGQMLNNYLIYIMFVMIAISAGGLFFNKRNILFAGIVSAGLLAIYLKNASNLSLKYPKANQETHLNLAHINLSYADGIQDIIDIVYDESLDVVSFQEFTPEWSDIINEILKDSYSFSFQYPSADPYGKAVYSKHNIINQSFIYLSGVPNATVIIEKDGAQFRLFSIYLTPALDKLSKQQSSHQLEKLADTISLDVRQTFVLGEFNQVYWTSDIMKFRKQTGLLNSRRDIIPNKSGVPFDHIFYSKDLECFSFNEINDNSGVHIGCKGSFQLKQKKNLK